MVMSLTGDVNPEPGPRSDGRSRCDPLTQPGARSGQGRRDGARGRQRERGHLWIVRRDDLHAGGCGGPARDACDRAERSLPQPSVSRSPRPSGVPDSTFRMERAICETPSLWRPRRSSARLSRRAVPLRRLSCMHRDVDRPHGGRRAGDRRAVAVEGPRRMASTPPRKSSSWNQPERRFPAVSMRSSTERIRVGRPVAPGIHGRPSGRRRPERTAVDPTQLFGALTRLNRRAITHT